MNMKLNIQLMEVEAELLLQKASEDLVQVFRVISGPDDDKFKGEMAVEFIEEYALTIVHVLEKGNIK